MVVGALPVADLEGGVGGVLVAADAVAGVEDQAQGAAVTGGGGERVVGLVAVEVVAVGVHVDGDGVHGRGRADGGSVGGARAWASGASGVSMRAVTVEGRVTAVITARCSHRDAAG